ncbi:MAG: DUF2236 domain-containing protein [Verrucomicrobia bacterium]|nr:DUF2236 domain-containing protein [Verrucomicrobiota bacterium]
MSDAKWNNEFLDPMRKLGDSEIDPKVEVFMKGLDLIKVPFTESDIIDPSTFLAELKQQTDGLSKYLFERFSKDRPDLLSTENIHEWEAQVGIADELNRISQDPPALLYEASKSSNGVSLFDTLLSQKEKELLASQPTGIDRIRLNRILFEKAYPKEIKKNLMHEWLDKQYENIATANLLSDTPANAGDPAPAVIPKTDEGSLKIKNLIQDQANQYQCLNGFSFCFFSEEVTFRLNLARSATFLANKALANRLFDFAIPAMCSALAIMELLNEYLEKSGSEAGSQPDPQTKKVLMMGNLKYYNRFLEIIDSIRRSPGIFLSNDSLRKEEFRSYPTLFKEAFRPALCPDWVDEKQLRTGVGLWQRDMVGCLLVAFAYSLPACYLDKNGIPTLYRSERLTKQKFLAQRIYETAFFLNDVMREDGLWVLRDSAAIQLVSLAVAVHKFFPDWTFQLGRYLTPEWTDPKSNKKYGPGDLLNLLSPPDVKNCSSFIAKLNQQSGGLSKYLFERFSQDAPGLLSITPQPPIQKIVDELNRIIQGSPEVPPDSLYEASKTSGVSPFETQLSPEAKDLLSTNPAGMDPLRLNRMLLHLAYPQEIAKKSYFSGIMDDCQKLERGAKIPDDKYPEKYSASELGFPDFDWLFRKYLEGAPPGKSQFAKGRALWGPGFLAAVKVRYFHALMRYYVNSKPGPAPSTHESPINQEDLAYTLLTFGYVIPLGLTKLGAILSREEKEAFLHFWRLIGYLMGISEDLLPEDWDQAKELYEIIKSRQQAPSWQGVKLTRALCQFIEDLLPAWLPFRSAIAPVLIRDQMGGDADFLLDGSSFLRVEDIKNPASLVAKLNPQSDGVSKYLFERFSRDVPGLLSGPQTPTRNIQGIVDGLNNILQTPTAAYWFLLDSDIKNPESFLAKILQQSDGVSKFLFDWLNLGRIPDKDRTVGLIVWSINSQCNGCYGSDTVSSLYQASTTNGVSPFDGLLSPEVKALLASDPSGPELRRLNHKLLECAYPLEIARTPPPSLYEALKPSGVRTFDRQVSQEANDLLRGHPAGLDLLRVNRMLLDDAYPQEIAKRCDNSPNQAANLVVRMCWAFVKNVLLRGYFLSRYLFFDRIGLAQAAIDRSVHFMGKTLIASWRQGFDRHPFDFTSSDKGFTANPNVSQTEQEEGAVTRKKVFGWVAVGLGLVLLFHPFFWIGVASLVASLLSSAHWLGWVVKAMFLFCLIDVIGVGLIERHLQRLTNPTAQPQRQL